MSHEKHLLKHMKSAAAALNNKYILFFLDYDGTLTPIVDKPDLAKLAPSTKTVLEELAKIEQAQVYVVSGRSRRDVQEKVGINDIMYVGNHGLEIEHADLGFKGFSFSRFREILEYIKWEVSKELVFFKGAFIEDKGLGLSIHYRLLSPNDALILKKLCNEVVGRFHVLKEILITEGKKVIEIRPPLEWDKGKAVMWIINKQQSIKRERKIFPIYIGDDSTDEDAFLALNGKGLTVHVGSPEHTRAEYYLNTPQEVIEFLNYCVRHGK